jgi:hypothetical protein
MPLPAAFRLLLLLWVTVLVPSSVLSEAVLPPVGAHSHRTLALPVIGTQTVELFILSATVAHLSMKGAISLDEPVNYFAQNGGLCFGLSESTKKLLRRMRTSLRNAGCSPPRLPPPRLPH